MTNVVHMVLDDMHQSQVNAYSPFYTIASGMTGLTPNLDALATSGIMYTNCFANPVCSPSRVLFHTMRYAARTGVGRGIVMDDETRVCAPDQELFLCDMANAYEHMGDMAMFGKYHMAADVIDGVYAPQFRAWDYYDTNPTILDEAGGETYVNWPRNLNGTLSVETAYHTEKLTDDFITWLGTTPAEPFMAVINFHAPHSPFHNPHDLQPESTGAHAADPFPSSVINHEQYKNMIARLDFHVGEIMAAIDLTDTVVMVWGDNGTPQSVTQAPYTPADAKGSVFHTGTGVPCFIAGPAAIVVSPGRVEHSLVSIADLGATTLELLGVDPRLSVPAERVLDGISILPTMQNPGTTSKRRFCFTERTNPLRGTEPGFILQEWNYCFRNERFALISINSNVTGDLRKTAELNEIFIDRRGDEFEATDLLTTLAPLDTIQKASLERLRDERNEMFDSFETRLSAI